MVLLSLQCFVTCISSVICRSTISSSYSSRYATRWSDLKKSTAVLTEKKSYMFILWFDKRKTCCTHTRAVHDYRTQPFGLKAINNRLCVYAARPGGELGALREELGLGASLELQASVWLKATSSCRRLWIRLYSWRRFWKICSVGSKEKQGQKLLKPGQPKMLSENNAAAAAANVSTSAPEKLNSPWRATLSKSYSKQAIRWISPQ